MSYIRVAACVIGPAHIASDRGREDSFATRVSSDGQWVAAVVSDGCGSVPYARKGADFISGFVSDCLLALRDDIGRRGPGEWLVDAIVKVLADLRDQMRATFGANIKDYAATVVGAMMSPQGGFIVHVGDGIASAFQICNRGEESVLELLTQSDPRNGEYANETFYVTDYDWIKNVRITPFGAADCLLLSTDGAQPLLYDLNRPSLLRISSLFKQLYRGGSDAASEAL
jgi:hypothetical protein